MRLFNLAPDVKAATMTVGGKAIASSIAYSLGSAPPTARNLPGLRCPRGGNLTLGMAVGRPLGGCIGASSVVQLLGWDRQSAHDQNGACNLARSRQR